jgi:hypothetical protein
VCFRDGFLWIIPLRLIRALVDPSWDASALKLLPRVVNVFVFRPLSDRFP